MSYGSRFRRVPARGGNILTDVNFYKLLLLGQTERGIVDASGLPVVHDEIYGMGDYEAKCGGYNSSDYAAYVLNSFYDELEKGLGIETTVLSYVDSSAVQASYSVLDGAAAEIFSAKAGYKSLNDKSAFGNKIGIKITQKNDITMKLTAELAESATSCTLDNVDNLEVGNYIKFTEGSDTEVKVITGITTATKTVTFSAITDSAGFSVVDTTVSRLDWKLEIAVKDDKGNYQKKEEWLGPFAQSDTIGLAGDVNDSVTGSQYLILEVDVANVSAAASQIPAELTTWTALASGADGSDAVDADWNTLATTYLASQEFAIMLAPESASTTHNQNMLNYATDNYKGMYYAQASNGATEAILKNFGALMRGSVKFGMLPSDKWIEVSDPTTVGGKKDVPKVGVDAAHWFNTYYKFGESKVAAGNKPEMVLKSTAKLDETNGLVHDDLDGQGDRLIRNYSVNICKFTRGKGITNNSARTFSTDGGYQWQNQIMQFLLYGRSIVAYLKTIEQDKAGYTAQEAHYNAVWTYMKKKYDAGHLFIGQKEDGNFTTFKEVCTIVNDFSVNTLASIASGTEETFMQCVFPPPIEYAVLSLASAAVTTVSGV